jgi:hypothetical protein
LGACAHTTDDQRNYQVGDRPHRECFMSGIS